MDPASRSPDHPDRAASAEASSTRPNPFDDSDISSRKRRRTSLSGSPANFLDAENPIRDSSSSTTLDIDPVLPRPDTGADSLTDPVAPETPGSGSRMGDPPTEPPSSMVTLNLRNATQKDSSSLPSSPTTAAQRAVTENATDAVNDHVQESVEDSEVYMSQAPQGNDFSRPSSSQSATPPIEVISIQSDEDMMSDYQSAGLSVVDSDLVAIDPVHEFPFNEPNESLEGIMTRLATYLGTQSSIDPAVIHRLQQWLGQYLDYTRNVSRQTAMGSCRLNIHFWVTFPRIVPAMAYRRPPLYEDETLWEVSSAFFASFATLSAWFVSQDIIAIKEFMVDQESQNRQIPELFSPIYLHHLHSITQPPRPSDSQTDQVAPTASYFVRAYQKSANGSIGSLLQLARILAELIPSHPRLTNDLASICQVASDIMSDTLNPRIPSHDLMSKQELENGFALYELICRIFDDMIEKKPSQLFADNILRGVSALSDMIKAILRCGLPIASHLLQEHQKSFPAVSEDYAIEAVALKRRFETFIKLIRSSQMQLRFQGTTQMCRELVECWRIHSEQSDDSHAYIGHIAEYLIGSGFIDYFLGSNCHPEIILEGANIVGFIIVTKNYRKEHLDMIWRGMTSGEDPRTVDALARMMSGIAHLFDIEGLLALCDMFQTLPVDAFTSTIRLLWDHVMQFLTDRPAIEQPLGIQPYNLCLRLLRESSVSTGGSQPVSPEMQQITLHKLQELLRCGPGPEGRQQLYLSCLQDIANKSATTLGSLYFLSTTIRSRVMCTELHRLVEENDFTRLLVEELEHAITIGRAMNSQTVLASPTYQPRKEFIAVIIQLEPQTITQELGFKLWNLLVGSLSLSLEDRRAGWDILNILNRGGNFDIHSNHFLRTCLLHYLPTLSAEYFCEGTLEFLLAEIMPRLNEKSDLPLDDQEAVNKSGIEQVWRIALEAEDEILAEKSLQVLTQDIYIKNEYISSGPTQRTQSIHLALVGRCLKQLKIAAKDLETLGLNPQGGNDGGAVFATKGQKLLEKERIFVRSLKFLRYMLDAHRSTPHLFTPDLRTLISQAPYAVQGDSAELKYQSFDGNQQTDIKPLVIGKGNTAASLLASLREETGFENYRIYYRGQPFLPRETDICKSLEDLRVHDGLILVRREDSGPAISNRVTPGASSLEIEISAHFDEMWEYLSMKDSLAEEIFAFLIQLPTDGRLSKLIDNEPATYKDVFPSGQPFKSLYAVHALAKYTDALSPSGINSDGSQNETFMPRSVSYSKALKTAMSLIVHAISDKNVFDQASKFMRLKLTTSLLQAFKQLYDRITASETPAIPKGLVIPDPDRLVEILSYAADCPGDEPSTAITLTLLLCLRLSIMEDQFWTKLSANTDFSRVLRRLILTDPRQVIRVRSIKIMQEFFTILEHTAVDRASDNNLDGLVATYFWTIARDLISEAPDIPHQCDELFRFTYFLLIRINKQAPELVNIATLAAKTSQLLLEHTTTETIESPDVEDTLARGLAFLLHLCLRLDATVAQSEVLPRNLAASLFWKQLYPSKRLASGEPVAKVILHEETRAKLCEVVFQLVKHHRDDIQMVLEGLGQQVPFYEDDDGMYGPLVKPHLLTDGPDNPYLYDLSYHFERSRALRAPCGYAGLQNLSNTCYLNSLMAQLYMNTGFRCFVLGCRVRYPETNQQLLHNTQKLFGHMQESYLRYIDPTDFVNSIKTYDDTLIDIHNQMDVDEFYNLLFDRWENQLLGQDEKRRMKSFYGGQLVQQVKSKECEHISERLEPFSAIQCDIKGKSTLEESLQAYVDGEIMEGDNKYKCSTCDRHVDAVKRACIKDVPENLIFHLKRFDFNLRTLQRSKINDYFSFPSRVDMRPYTIEHLSNPESDGEEDMFELVGVLVHSGTAESGHYYSYIRERPSSVDSPSWVEFNDDMVAPWDPAQMEQATFGGTNQRPLQDSNGLMFDRNYSAYMLFYQRASSLRAEQENMMSLNVPAPFRVEVPEKLKYHTTVENTVILRRHCIYDESNTGLVLTLFRQSLLCCGPVDTTDTCLSPNDFMCKFQQEHGLQNSAMRTLLGHLDQVVTRAKEIPHFGSYCRDLMGAITSCPYCAFAFYSYFDHYPNALRMLLQRNPDQGVRIFTCNALVTAVKKISEAFPNIYDLQESYSSVSDSDEDEDLDQHDVSRHSVIDRVMLIFDYLWKHFHLHIKAWDEYFGAIIGFAELGHRETGRVLAADFLLRTIQIISADPLQDLSGVWAKMLNSVIRRNNSPKPPSYTSIIALIQHLISKMSWKLGTDSIEEDPTERLTQTAGPFRWTSSEVTLVFNGLDMTSHTSLFVEKLLALDQAPASSDAIIRCLVRLDDKVDDRVLSTLKQCLRGETSTQAMDPFLRAAIPYLDSTNNLNNALEIVQHMLAQARSLQNNEGVFFVRFFMVAANLQREDEEFARAVRSHSLGQVSEWVPFLLAWSDQHMRSTTKGFLSSTLFDNLKDHSPANSESTCCDRDAIEEAAKQVGIACLEYLKDHHVRRRANVGREIATDFLDVIEQCGAVVNVGSNEQSDTDKRFCKLQDDVIDPLRKLVVDDMEDDGTDWEGSCGSSDQIDDIEMNIPGVKELHGM
ncbi:hypothetical protein HYE67_003686 [Fusarium culmorum]|uniref:Ubiquitin carboxyl-terminal hydrolase 34 n=1 Tax=Fusarium culmorum TaxID=5516 RepID=A0A2T4GR30_FUSCU|nr:Ubiquitin carboxyl-terminal hydrolase 34 [Fusarium culmorum]QPC61455.1 hypothetical protein HYE67_003686 [Fusarium culmorum]